jgi:hypothetical protein
MIPSSDPKIIAMIKIREKPYERKNAGSLIFILFNQLQNRNRCPGKVRYSEYSATTLYHNF